MHIGVRTTKRRYYMLYYCKIFLMKEESKPEFSCCYQENLSSVPIQYIRLINN